MSYKVLDCFEVGGKECYIIKIPTTNTETGKEILNIAICEVVATITEYDVRTES